LLICRMFGQPLPSGRQKILGVGHQAGDVSRLQTRVNAIIPQLTLAERPEHGLVKTWFDIVGFRKILPKSRDNRPMAGKYQPAPFEHCFGSEEHRIIQA